ncbi:normal mucosa of esophagus-specific gene 1 protein [Rhineura floridana]|uniref:normal mucosa of esophagus-specific gene 1 protein n=1 Tax=Rhineura floridana TaxID=261503 RepID=UPI002AC816BF|nr:normal mucosa of esophagus-specific gene 1 protein [Rhineura floridana]XP_061451269.1 normal mucosa of esophagus-specific gene 1 protein [Rhineura floridana]
MRDMGLFQLMMKKKELIPMVAFVSCAGFAALYSCWHALRKPEVVFNKTGNPEPWQNVDPTKPQKLLTINQEWKAIEELEKVRSVTK